MTTGADAALASQEERLVCVVCPIGCTLTVKSDVSGKEHVIAGFRCRRGLDYARTELTDPRRVLTATLATTDSALRRLPVKTAGTIPKRSLLEAARYLRGVVVYPPVSTGDVVVRNLLGSGVDVVATRDLLPAVQAETPVSGSALSVDSAKDDRR